MNTLALDFCAALTPPPDIPAWKWCEEHITLSPKQSTAFPGPYRTSLTPYVRGIFDAFQDSDINVSTIMKGAQTGLTQTVHCWHVYLACENPGPALIIMPTERMGRSLSETRIQPLFKDSARARQELPLDKDHFKLLEYQLKQCNINIEGSNSASGLATRTVRDLTMDESDKYPVDMLREANPPELAVQRTKTYWNRHIIKISTPTTEDGYINRSYLEGDRRKYYVPCPHCQGSNFLKWSQFKFDSELPPDKAGKSAYYECENCQGQIKEKHRKKMMEAGEWRATCEGVAPNVASFHLPSFYSPWVKWADLVAKFCRVKAFPGQLRDFINSDLGEPWQAESVSAVDELLTDRRRPYKVGEWPSKTGILKGDQFQRYLTVDVQKFHFWVCVREWSPGGNSALILYDKAFAWAELTELADSYECAYILIDCGYGERTQEVYEACWEHHMIPCKGASNKVTLMWAKTEINPFEGTRRGAENEKIGMIVHDTDSAKLQLMDRINGVSPDIGGEPTFEWLIPENISAEYCAHVTAEKFDPSKNKWVSLRRDNHAVDVEVLQILAATMFGYNTRIFNED